LAHPSVVGLALGSAAPSAAAWAVLSVAELERQDFPLAAAWALGWVVVTAWAWAAAWAVEWVGQSAMG